MLLRLNPKYCRLSKDDYNLLHEIFQVIERRLQFTSCNASDAKDWEFKLEKITYFTLSELSPVPILYFTLKLTFTSAYTVLPSYEICHQIIRCSIKF